MKKYLMAILISLLLINTNLLAAYEVNGIVETATLKMIHTQADVNILSINDDVEIRTQEACRINVKTPQIVNILTFCILLLTATTLYKQITATRRRPRKKKHSPKEMLAYIERLTRAPNPCA